MPNKDKPDKPTGINPMSLFPTLNSMEEVLALAESKVPITSKNELFALLMTYQNTLLSLTRNANEKP